MSKFYKSIITINKEVKHIQQAISRQLCFIQGYFITALIHTGKMENVILQRDSVEIIIGILLDQNTQTEIASITTKRKLC